MGLLSGLFMIWMKRTRTVHSFFWSTSTILSCCSGLTLVHGSHSALLKYVTSVLQHVLFYRSMTPSFWQYAYIFGGTHMLWNDNCAFPSNLFLISLTSSYTCLESPLDISSMVCDAYLSQVLNVIACKSTEASGTRLVLSILKDCLLFTTFSVVLVPLFYNANATALPEMVQTGFGISLPRQQFNCSGPYLRGSTPECDVFLNWNIFSLLLDLAPLIRPIHCVFLSFHGYVLHLILLRPPVHLTCLVVLVLYRFCRALCLIRPGN